MVKKGRIVLATGAFDIVHMGHIKMLHAAKRLAGKNGKLIVVIARNETVIKNKGREPVFDEKDRRAIIENIKPVDKAILGYRPFSFRRIINKVKPDIVVFGYDQVKLMESFRKFCEENNIRGVKIVRLRRYETGKINSSSDVLKRILKKTMK